MIDLNIKEMVVPYEDLAMVVIEDVCRQLGLTVDSTSVKITDFELFKSHVPEILKDTKIKLPDPSHDIESTIIRELKILEKDYNGEAVPVGDLMVVMSEKYDKSMEFTLSILKSLTAKGQVYQPTTNYYKTI